MLWVEPKLCTRFQARRALLRKLKNYNSRAGCIECAPGTGTVSEAQHQWLCAVSAEALCGSLYHPAGLLQPWSLSTAAVLPPDCSCRHLRLYRSGWAQMVIVAQREGKERKERKGKERKGKERKGKERTTPFGVNFKRSQVSHRAAQIQMVIVAAWRWM